MRVAIYARVSTADQTAENQLLELRAIAAKQGWTVDKEYIDHGISGAKGRDERPQLDAMLKSVARREVHKVMVWSVDRLGRSLLHLLETLGEFHSTGTGLYIHQQGIDTGTPAGKALFSMLGIFAEFERAIIQERIKAGLQRAKEQGKQLGRKPVGPEVEQRIRDLRAAGVGICKTAKLVGCGVGTVQRVDRELA